MSLRPCTTLLKGIVPLSALFSQHGEATKLERILGKETMQEITDRTATKPEPAVTFQLFRDKETDHLFWKENTDGFMGTRHEVLDPVTWNKSLPREGATLTKIAQLPKGALPPILEEAGVEYVHCVTSTKRATMFTDQQDTKSSGQGTADSAQPPEGTADGAPSWGFPKADAAGPDEHDKTTLFTHQQHTMPFSQFDGSNRSSIPIFVC